MNDKSFLAALDSNEEPPGRRAGRFDISMLVVYLKAAAAILGLAVLIGISLSFTSESQINSGGLPSSGMPGQSNTVSQPSTLSAPALAESGGGDLPARTGTISYPEHRTLPYTVQRTTTLAYMQGKPYRVMAVGNAARKFVETSQRRHRGIFKHCHKGKLEWHLPLLWGTDIYLTGEACTAGDNDI